MVDFTSASRYEWSAEAVPVQAGPTYAERRHYGTGDHLGAKDTRIKYPWTAQMDDILLDRREQKWKWEQISQQCFAGRKSANACRKRHSRTLSYRSVRCNEDKTAHTRALKKVDSSPVDSTKTRHSRHVQRGLLRCKL